jgi:hypothetical protein
MRDDATGLLILLVIFSIPIFLFLKEEKCDEPIIINKYLKAEGVYAESKYNIALKMFVTTPVHHKDRYYFVLSCACGKSTEKQVSKQDYENYQIGDLLKLTE